MKIDSYTILTALFASPCRHSISPIMHNEAFNKLSLNYAYLSFEVDKNNLEDAVNSIRTLNMRGANLSMPNKKEVIKYLDKLSKSAELSQSVNTIVNDNGILIGYSTDGEGFIKSLEEEQVFIKNKNIVILGIGGASICRKILHNNCRAGGGLTNFAANIQTKVTPIDLPPGNKPLFCIGGDAVQPRHRVEPCKKF